MVANLDVEGGGDTPSGINRTGENRTYLILVGVAIGNGTVQIGCGIGGKTAIESGPGTAIDRTLDFKIIFVAGSITPDNIEVGVGIGFFNETVDRSTKSRRSGGGKLLNC